MLGCMLCTSRAISAALPLAPLARFADLDGPTWLAVDVEPALHFSTGVLHLEDASAAGPSSPAGIFRRFVGGDRRNSAVMQGRPISAHQLPKEPGVS
jgi:hypothetical protein